MKPDISTLRCNIIFTLHFCQGLILLCLLMQLRDNFNHHSCVATRVLRIPSVALGRKSFVHDCTTVYVTYCATDVLLSPDLIVADYHIWRVMRQETSPAHANVGYVTELRQRWGRCSVVYWTKRLTRSTTELDSIGLSCFSSFENCP